VISLARAIRRAVPGAPAGRGEPVEVFLTYALTLLLAWPLGRYMSQVFHGERTWLDLALNPLENALYRLMRVNPNRGMTWRGYALAILFSNLPLAVIGYLIFTFQGALPLNPDRIPGMSWDLALHTASSFITNTNQQHYSGQSQLSYLSQLAAITTMQFVTPAVGLAAMVAVLRGLMGGRNGVKADLGNYYVDVTRAITRVLIPLSFVLALLLTWQGVPSAFSGAKIANLIEPYTVTNPDKTSTRIATQTIPVGPVAPMVAIKQLGTNGGGWYGPNSAVPLENPTPLSNLLQTISIILIPVAGIFMVGYFLRRPRFGVMVLGVMTLLSAVLMIIVVGTGTQPNPAFAGLAAPGPNMEGVETRFGPVASQIWATLTTQTSNGSVNVMHDSMNPLALIVPFVGMWLNLIFGGDGVGFLNFFITLIVTVFIAGLMVGRTPELFGRKIEAREMKLASLALLLIPLLILVPGAIALSIPAITANSNPGFHGLSQVLYEYSSAAANNGSGLAGLGTGGSVWWNVSCAVVLILGRFIPIIAPLAIAGYLSLKKEVPVSSGTLRVETTTFASALLAVIIVVNALEYFPIAVLGPVAESLTVGQPLPQPVPMSGLEITVPQVNALENTLQDVRK
jgi:K+-transporting ATPase ATPase A chain